MLKTAIIIQARTNSTRLPNKVILPFFQDKSILKILIEKLKKTGIKLYVATTKSDKDNLIEKIADETGVNCFRGDEKNVLSRFYSICKKNNLTHAIRVCSDNPFINISLLKDLVNNLKNYQSMDYVGFFDQNDRPMILSHFGIFSEIISFNALKKIFQSKAKQKYLEHVTNYVYENPNKFSDLNL